MPRLVRNFPEPTDVYFIGVDFIILGTGTIPDEFIISITDDYTTIGLTNGEKTRNVQTAGHLIVMTYAELKAHRHLFKFKDEELEYVDDIDEDVFVAKNLQGDMLAEYITNKGRQVLTSYDPEQDFMYQNDNELEDDTRDSPEWVEDYNLVLPAGTEIRGRYKIVNFLKQLDAKILAENNHVQ